MSQAEIEIAAVFFIIAGSETSESGLQNILILFLILLQRQR